MEFCLEDGTRLVESQHPNDELPTATAKIRSNIFDEETVNLADPSFVDHKKLKNSAFITNRQNSSPETIKSNLIDENINSPNYKILEIAPLVVSLAHNWWQWVYLNNQYYSSFSAYVISANFLLWLLLLISGTIVGLLGLKHSRNKNFAYAGLIILSINLLLFLVPRR